MPDGVGNTPTAVTRATDYINPLDVVLEHLIATGQWSEAQPVSKLRELLRHFDLDQLESLGVHELGIAFLRIASELAWMILLDQAINLAFADAESSSTRY